MNPSEPLHTITRRERNRGHGRRGVRFGRAFRTPRNLQRVC